MTRPVLLAGGAALLAATGCAQDDREYIKVPADTDLAWYAPEEAPGWYTGSEDWDDSGYYAADNCNLRLSHTEGQADAPAYDTPEDSARNWIGMRALQLGSGVPEATVTTLDPIEIPTDTEGSDELVEFTTMEAVDEEADLGVRVGVHWNGDDELRFMYTCSAADSWSDGEEGMAELLEDVRVVLP